MDGLGLGLARGIMTRSTARVSDAKRCFQFEPPPPSSWRTGAYMRSAFRRCFLYLRFRMCTRAVTVSRRGQTRAGAILVEKRTIFAPLTVGYGQEYGEGSHKRSYVACSGIAPLSQYVVCTTRCTVSFAQWRRDVTCVKPYLYVRPLHTGTCLASVHGSHDARKRCTCLLSAPRS